MQSLESAARTCVLGALAGAVLTVGCGRPNPGFKLKDTGAEQGESTTQGPVSDTTDTAPPPTTSSTTTTGESMTTAGPAVSGSDSEATTTTTGDPSTTTTTGDATSSSTTGPVGCQQPLAEHIVTKPLYDTYLMAWREADNSGGGCNLFMKGGDGCEWYNFGKTALQKIFHASEEQDAPQSFFAVRFKFVNWLPVDVAVDQVEQVELSLVVDYAGPEDVTLGVYQLAKSDEWSEGASDLALAANSEVTFACRKTTKVGVDYSCNAENRWADDEWPVDPADPTIGSFTLNGGEKLQGKRIYIPLSVLEDNPQFFDEATGLNKGFVVIPSLVSQEDGVGVYAQESPGQQPQLRVQYCPD